MNYVERINSILIPKENGGSLVLDLFAGCGGLALGFESQGFMTRGFEQNTDACETYNRNLLGKCEQVTLSVNTNYPQANVIIGGPPCQPFSVGGLQLGLNDSRDGFPIFIAAIKNVKPDIWLFENVRGIFYKNQAYFKEIISSIESLHYVVEIHLINSVNYGIPQNRERVIVIGHRGEFHFPAKDTVRVTSGEAIGDTMYQMLPQARYLTPSMDGYIAKYEQASSCINPRDLDPNKPSRTLTCRNLSGATGDMQRIKLSDGRRRRLILREAARLQSFPDWFEFCGSENSQFKQVGNAVPPLLAYRLARAIRNYLESNKRLTEGEILYRRRPSQFALPLEVKESKEMLIPSFIINDNKPAKITKLLNEAIFLLSSLGVPVDGQTTRQLEKMAMVFLAVADVKRTADWSHARVRQGTDTLKSRDIITYINENFGENISMGSYDDIRRKDLKLPVLAGIIEASANKPNAARNDPTRGYSLSEEYIEIIQHFSRQDWDPKCKEFMAKRRTLAAQLSMTRNLETMPVKLPGGKRLSLSPGEHNRLQKEIVENLLPRYGFNSEVLYLGDTTNKQLYCNRPKLKSLKFIELEHGELPDVVAYSENKNWIFLIEAVHSSGPISQIRLLELQRLTKGCSADIVYITAFLNRETFRKFSQDIAWETEVWIVNSLII